MRLLFYPELGDREVDELMPGIGVSLVLQGPRLTPGAHRL